MSDTHQVATSPTDQDDVVRRNIKRDLPCKLTDEEFMRISKMRVMKEAEQEELTADLNKEKKRRMEQIELIDDEVRKMRNEMRSGYQDRTVSCNEIFRKHDDGTGWIYTIRLDTYGEVERRPATAHETQRYLPSVGLGHEAEPIAEKAGKKKRKAKDADEADLPVEA